MSIDAVLGHYPKFTVTVGTGAGARTPTVEGLRFSSTVNGGHDRLEARISNNERLSGGGNYNAWTPMQVAIATGETGAGTVVWDGYVARKVLGSPDSKCKLFGVGASELARTTYKSRLYRADDYSLWGARDSEDFNFPANYRHISAAVDDRLLFTAEGGAYGVNNVGGVAAAVEAPITKISFVNNKGVSHENFSYRIRTFTPPLLNGDTANAFEIGTISLGVNGVATGSTVSRTATGVQQKTGICIDLMCDTAVTLADTSAFKVACKTVRLYGRATTDNYYASDVVTDVGFNLLGWNVALVQATTTPILPVYWTRSAPLADLLDMMCDADQMFWRVRNRSAGIFQIEFSTWTNAASINWFASVADRAVGDYAIEASDDLINQANVYYKTLRGRRKVAIGQADGLSGRPVDPFAGTVRAFNQRPVMLDYDIGDPQPDSTYPQAVANGLIKDYGVQRYEGSVELASSHQGSIGGTERFAPIIMAGDRLTLTDGVQAGTYRIYEAEHSQDGPTRLTIGRRPGVFNALVAKHLKKLERKGQS